MKNVELKVVLSDFQHVAAILKKMEAKFEGRLLQIDTYYNCKNGRLKLREINGKNFELIFYRRPDTGKSKISDYEILKINKNKANDTKDILRKSLGENVIVKQKYIWIM